MENGKFGPQSYIGVGLVIVIIGATWTLSHSLSGIDRAVDKLDFRMTELEKHQSRPDPWTGVDMLKWAIELGKSNPNMKVPEPTHKEIK